MSSETMDRETTSGVEVSVGTPAFPPGRTQVALEPSGRLLVASELEGAERRHEEAKLEPERARELIATTGETVARAREGKRLGLPDEPRYHIAWVEGDQRRSADIWRSELKEYPEIARLIAELQQAVSEQVEGEIIL